MWWWLIYPKYRCFSTDVTMSKAGLGRRVCQVGISHIHSIVRIRNCSTSAACETIVLALVMSRVNHGYALLYGVPGLCCISCRWSRILRRDSLLGPAEEITSHQFCLVFIRCPFANELNSTFFPSNIALSTTSGQNILPL